LSSALDQIDHDIDVATRRFGIRTGLVRGVDQGPRHFAVQAWQADVEASPEKVSSVSSVQVYFGVDGGVGRENDLIFIFRAASPIAPSKQADQPAANNCSGLVPMPAVPGVESLMSRWPSELRDTPCSRPPAVWVLPVYRSFSFGGKLGCLSRWFIACFFPSCVTV
jgi:hypothetical protein